MGLSALQLESTYTDQVWVGESVDRRDSDQTGAVEGVRQGVSVSSRTRGTGSVPYGQTVDVYIWP